MGIQGLTTLLKRYAPNSLSHVLTQQYKGKTLAIDASCYLNKYIYGDEIHAYKHIYGFYMLARFCEKNDIKPLFIFDGMHRIQEKELWEGKRRERSRYKIDQSLLFEEARSIRLDNWLTILQSDYLSSSTSSTSISNHHHHIITLQTGRRILKKLNHVHDIYKNYYKMVDKVHDSMDDNKINSKKKVTTTKGIMKKNNKMIMIMDQNEKEEPSTNQQQHQHHGIHMDDYQTQQLKEQKKLERKLVKIAKELGQTLDYVQDKNKYTKTVRDLSSKEYQLMTTMIQDKIKNIKSDIQELQHDNDQMILSLTKRSIRITPELRQESKLFLSSLGYVCFTCENHEAEAFCANLVKNRKADGTISEDLDTIAFGDTLLLRFFFAKKRPILQIDPIKARQELNLTSDQFLDLCILCGTDFGPKIRGVGPIRALQLIKTHGSIENILTYLDTQKYMPEEGFDFYNIRKIFRELPNIPLDEESYKPSLVDTITVNSILGKYQIDPDEVNERLELITNEQKHQYNIDINSDISFGNNPFQQEHHHHQQQQQQQNIDTTNNDNFGKNPFQPSYLSV